MKHIKKLIIWGVSLPLFASANTPDNSLPLTSSHAADIIKSLYTEGVGYTIPAREAQLIRRVGGDPCMVKLPFQHCKHF